MWVGARHAPRDARELSTNARNTSQEAIAMRNLGRGVIVGAATFLAACGGGTKNADTTSAAAPAAGQPAAGASASASAPAGGAATGTGTAQAATGKTWEVKMVGDASGYKFDPANLTIKEGDA